MPSGETHNKYTMASSVVGGITVAVATADPAAVVVYTLSHVILGTLVTPDLDLAENRFRYFSLTNIAKYPVRWAWYTYWGFYGIIFKHRGISHWPVIGTLTRLFYMFWPVLIYIFIFDPSFNEITIYYAKIAIISMMVADTVHAALDWLT